jgi:hypothetical protein
MATLAGEDLFPTTVVFQDKSAIPDFIRWYKENEAELQKILLRSGAILFRGVNIETVVDFEGVMDSISTKFMAYIDGNSPRTKLSSKVYTSTEYDPNHSITMHNELSYSYAWPAKIYFCCITPAASGGETPIADCRKVLAHMNPDLVEEIERKKIVYIRNLNNGGMGFGPSWQDTFETQDKSEVDAFCKKASIQLQWKADGSLKLIQPSQGIIKHPVTGEKVWFNQIDQFHPSHLNAEIYETLMLMYNDEGELPMYVTFGDGSKVTEGMVKEIHKTMEQVAVANPWKKGDLIMLDNVLTCHGRRPFKGDRKIVVSMGN